MPTFSLNTSFDQNSLRMLYASGSNVVVGKPNAGGSPNVAWIVFRPMMRNQMTWEEQYGIYASTTSIMNGARLVQMSTTNFPASSGQVYPLLPAGYFGPPQSGGVPGSYGAINQFNNLPQGYLTIGLFQNAMVNGSNLTGNAVSAAPVLYQSTAVMTPYATVYIWIQSQVMSNTIVTNVTSVQTRVTFGGSVTSISLMFDPNTGGFIQSGGNLKLDENTRTLAATGGQALGDGLELEYLLPVLG
jgi:hypothetical protein